MHWSLILIQNTVGDPNIVVGSGRIQKAIPGRIPCVRNLARMLPSLGTGFREKSGGDTLPVLYHSRDKVFDKTELERALYYRYCNFDNAINM